MTASIESEGASPQNADGDGVNGPEANTKSAVIGECLEGLPGSKERGMRGEKCQGLGRPWWLPDIGRERGV